MNENNPLVVYGWLILSALGGAITSLSFKPYRQMAKIEIGVAFVVSFTFAIFVGSAVADFVAKHLFGDSPANLRVYGLVMWFMASGSNFLIPVAFTRAKCIISAIGATESDK